MRVKHLKKLLNSFDENLEIMNFYEEIGQYFDVDAGDFEMENVYHDPDGTYIEEELARNLFEQGKFDKFNEKNIKKVLVIN